MLVVRTAQVMTSDFDELEKELRQNLKLRRELGAKAAKARDSLAAERHAALAKLARKIESEIAEINSGSAAADDKASRKAAQRLFWLGLLVLVVAAFVVW
jgi:hypothetical protein